MDLNQLQPRSVWVELPSRWIRVVARFSRPRSLDPLESTILQLVGLIPRTDAELAEMLGDMPVEVVTSALRTLQAMDRVHEQPGDVPRWMAPPEPMDGLEDPEVGWVALCPHREAVIPELLPGHAPRQVRKEPGGHQELFLEESGIQPELPDGIPELLRRAVRFGMSRLVKVEHDEGRSTGAPGDWQPLSVGAMDAERGPRVTSLLVDWEQQGKKPTVVQQTRTCWALLEILPGLTGRTTLIFHEPQWVPDLDGVRPISPHLGGWIQEHLPGTWRRIEQLQREVRVDHSWVLQLANIKDMDSLEALVDRHRSGWRTKLPGAEDFFLGWGDPLLKDLLRDAHRWLLLWQQRPGFVRQAVDAYGHAIERLAQVLALQSLPALRRWAEWWRASKDDARTSQQAHWASGRSAYVGALARVGLVDALKTSEEHLRRALKNLKSLPEALEQHQGAGSSITLWLLPLFLAEEAERTALAARLGRIVSREPMALTLLAELILLRNDAAHSRLEPSMRPDRADEHLAHLLWALSAGLAEEG